LNGYGSHLVLIIQKPDWRFPAALDSFIQKKKVLMMMSKTV
jgi:hypothetical protein